MPERAVHRFARESFGQRPAAADTGRCTVRARSRPSGGVMASPLVEAVEHFSLPQLMADPNLCRNVLNDIGAQPAEVFLLVAALEARVPQTLMEHKATNDLSVVEARLVAELNQRGIERSRAEWAVNAWKDVVSGSPL